jgi:hypothetical protein
VCFENKNIYLPLTLKNAQAYLCITDNAGVLAVNSDVVGLAPELNVTK